MIQMMQAHCQNLQPTKTCLPQPSSQAALLFLSDNASHRLPVSLSWMLSLSGAHGTNLATSAPSAFLIAAEVKESPKDTTGLQ